MLGSICLAFLLSTNVNAEEKTVLPTDVTTASSGCTLVGVEGTYVGDAQEALKRINEIRYEACENEYVNPSSKTGEKLTLKNYVPIKWSSDLQEIATLRSAESSVGLTNWAHYRSNGNQPLTLASSNGIKASGECIAWDMSGTMLNGVNRWYKEKEDWVNQDDNKVTGHYTAMIDPSNTYVGLGAFLNDNAFYGLTVVGEFSKAASLDDTEDEPKGDVIQTIEVKNSDLSNARVSLENSEIEIFGETIATASLKANGYKVIPLSVEWSSSDTGVATVDSDGTLTGVHDGSATITAKINDDISATATLTVEGHDWNDGEITTEPTCTEKGVRTYTCNVCKTTKTEDIDALGHDFDYSTGTVKEPATCEKDGVRTYPCKRQDCNETKEESISATGHKESLANVKSATCTEAGYTGDTVCSVCKTTLEKGKATDALGHDWDKGTITKEATPTSDGEMTYTCKRCGETKTDVIQVKKIENVSSALKVGTQVQISGSIYQVTADGEVAFVKAKKNIKSLSIPATITQNGVTYKVTSIASKAVSNNKKIKSVTVGENIKKISKNAFYKCKNLKKVTLKTTSLTKKTASKASFKSVNKKITIKAPKSVKKSYKKVFKGMKVK